MDTIVETTDNRLFRVTDAGPDLDHCFLGVPVKRAGSGFVDRAKNKRQLVRRKGCKLIAGSLASDKRAVCALEYALLAAAVAVVLVASMHSVVGAFGHLLPHLSSTGRL